MMQSLKSGQIAAAEICAPFLACMCQQKRNASSGCDHTEPCEKSVVLCLWINMDQWYFKTLKTISHEPSRSVPWFLEVKCPTLGRRLCRWFYPVLFKICFASEIYKTLKTWKIRKSMKIPDLQMIFPYLPISSHIFQCQQIRDFRCRLRTPLRRGCCLPPAWHKSSAKTS